MIGTLVSKTAHFIAAISLVGVTTHSPKWEPTPVCRGPDSFSSSQISHLHEMMNSSDPSDSVFLANVKLPHVTSNFIGLITTDSLCALALQTWMTMDTVSSPSLTRLYVLKVGSSYDVIDKQDSGGEWSQHMVLDSAFHYKAPYLF
jgi:hypothetical protein